MEVRRGRKGRALLVDGTFASWYEPGLPVTGSVWDALAAPLLALPPQRRRSALILGLGGGSAARVVRALAPRARIVGVEREAEVVRAARRHLALDGIGVELVRADARRHLSRSRRRYDLVIEDLFVGRGRRVHKPDWVVADGLAAAARRVAPGGLLVSNTIDESAEVARELRRHFPRLLRIEVAEYDNRVLVAGPRALTARTLRLTLRRNRLLAATLPRLTLRTT